MKFKKYLSYKKLLTKKKFFSTTPSIDGINVINFFSFLFAIGKITINLYIWI